MYSLKKFIAEINPYIFFMCDRKTMLLINANISSTSLLMNSLDLEFLKNLNRYYLNFYDHVRTILQDKTCIIASCYSFFIPSCLHCYVC